VVIVSIITRMRASWAAPPKYENTRPIVFSEKKSVVMY
jgi:hypothetical protein